MKQWSKATRARVAFWVSISAYVVAVFGSEFILAQSVFPRSVQIAITVLPMLPAIATVFASMAQFYALDELERRIQAEGMMFAFVVTAVVTFAYGFLETAHAVPQASYFFVWAILASGWLVGSAIARVRYR